MHPSDSTVKVLSLRDLLLGSDPSLPSQDLYLLKGARNQLRACRRPLAATSCRVWNPISTGNLAFGLHGIS